MMQWRFRIVFILFLTSLAMVLGRLIVLQIFEKDYYQTLANENRIKVIPLRAERGLIYDENHEPMVDNGENGREYVLGKASSQVLGYIGEISQEEFQSCIKEAEKRGQKCQFNLQDLVGKMGLEKEYDQILRGVDGGILMEADADGQMKREIGRSEPVAGQSIELNLNLGLQRAAYEAIEEKRGAVVVSRPEGQVLALVSSPGFEPDKVADFIDDQNLPMFNRAVGGEYPPGSVFKIITSVAGLEEGKINKQTLVEDTGEIRIGDQWRYGNWYYDQYGKKEGELNLIRAIARSNDIFFYKLGEWLGITKLADWAKYFGVGSLTGIDLAGEAYGLMPDNDWKKEYKKESWFLGDTYISAIGQGDILMTPLQVNLMTQVIANGGRLCQMQLKKDQINCQDLEIETETIELVKQGMKEVNEIGGTAYPFFDFEANGQRLETAGKTGTAEFGPSDKTHAWYTVMAPVEKPEIVVTVLVEEGGEGSADAAPIAKKIINYWATTPGCSGQK